MAAAVAPAAPAAPDPHQPVPKKRGGDGGGGDGGTQTALAALEAAVDDDPKLAALRARGEAGLLDGARDAQQRGDQDCTEAATAALTTLCRAQLLHAYAQAALRDAPLAR